MNHQFTLVLKSNTIEHSLLVDSLYDAGCDDALINIKAGSVYLDFDREAVSFEEAVLSAINAVESASIVVVVINVAPEDWVTESEIAKRLDVTRQTVSLWMKKKRRTACEFPAPAMKLSNKSPLWKWREVTEWLYKNELMSQKEAIEKAAFLEILNAVLLMRQVKSTLLGQSILARLACQVL